VIYYKCSSFFFAPGRFPLWLSWRKNQTKKSDILAREVENSISFYIASAVWRWPSLSSASTHNWLLVFVVVVVAQRSGWWT
jgi:hypothetical protein